MAKSNITSITEKKMKIPILKMTDINKYFGETHALSGVDFDVYQGEVIGLIGPNGAGKSTLMKVITGDVCPSSGEIQIDDECIPFQNYNRKTVHSKGIVCVYQELSLCRNLSVYENFMLTHHNIEQFKGRNWRKKAKKFVKKSLDEVFPSNGIDVAKSVEEFAFGKQQMTEISRAVSFEGLRILILDEPTSSLTYDKIGQLHDKIRDLRKKGVTVIYVSHKLEEIKMICDRIVIMKNGFISGEVTSTEIATADLVTMLGGQKAEAMDFKQKTDTGETLVCVNNLTTKTLRNINIEIKSGEIVGLSGLGEAGQLDLLYEIYKAGMYHRNKKIETGKDVTFVSGDRQNKGVFRLWSIADNILISSIGLLSKWGVMDTKKSGELARHWFKKLKFVAKSENEGITSLSGGNQQKALIARGIAAKADIILLDDPTRGVDIETKQEIYRLLQEAKNSGKAILWFSTEDEEMLQCDRVLVMQSGEITNELEGSAVTIGEIVRVSFENKNSHKLSDSSAAIRGNNAFRNMKLTPTMLPFLTLFVIIIMNFLFNPNTVSYMGIGMTSQTALPLVFAALAQMVIIQIGDIDLSIGAGMGLINVIFATVMHDRVGLGILLCSLFVLGYVAMGALIHVRKIPSLVVTLGASFIWLGIAILIQPTPGGTVPDWLKNTYGYDFPVIPVPLIIAIGTAAVFYFILKKSRYGVVLRGAGNNPESVIHAGWSYFKAKIAAFALAGFFVVMAGMSFTALTYGSDANASSTFTMTSIAAVILGGCSFAGGLSEPVGVVGGAYAISMVSSLLVFIGLSTDYQSAIIGLILLLALLSRLLIKRRQFV